jgi:UDP-N-acetylmuramoylalanine-D-glutamate ligase
MEKKIESIEFEKLVATRKQQLASLKNIPNQLELVWESEDGAVLNNASSTDIEAALEAISAVKEKVIWITEMQYAEINFHGILGGILNKLEMIIHVGNENPLAKLGNACHSTTNLKEAIELSFSNMKEGVYVVYAPAIEPVSKVKERGETFRNLIKEIKG